MNTHNSAPFLFVGNGPYCNRGCEAISKCTIKLVREHYTDVPIINGNQMSDYDQVDETEPNVTHLPCRCMPGKFSRLGVSNWLYEHTRILVDFSSAGKFVRTWAPRSRAVLSMGGDLYGLSMGRACLIQYLFLGEAALACRKPFIIWCATIGRMEEEPYLKKRVMNHFKRCSLILVRESESLNYLAKNGVHDNVRLVADPAFLLEPVPPSVSLPIREPLSETIGINIAGAYAMTGKLGTYRDTVKLAADCVQMIMAETGRPVLLVPHVVATHVSAGDNDTIFLCLVREALLARGIDVPMLPSWMRSWEIKWVLGQLKAYIGSRFHSTISSMGAGTPTLSIVFSEKGPALNEFIFGHRQYVLDYASLTPERLLEKVDFLLSEEAEVRQILGKRIPEMQQLARSAGDYLAEVVPIEK